MSCWPGEKLLVKLRWKEATRERFLQRGTEACALLNMRIQRTAIVLFYFFLFFFNTFLFLFTLNFYTFSCFFNSFFFLCFCTFLKTFFTFFIFPSLHYFLLFLLFYSIFSIFTFLPAMKRAITNDLQASLEKLVGEEKDAAAKGDMGRVFAVTKKLRTRQTAQSYLR